MSDCELEEIKSTDVWLCFKTSRGASAEERDIALKIVESWLNETRKSGLIIDKLVTQKHSGIPEEVEQIIQVPKKKYNICYKISVFFLSILVGLVAYFVMFFKFNI